MTIKQLYLFNGFYLLVLVVVAILTRTTARRIAGALAGGLAVGVVALGIIALDEKARWWHQAITWEPYFVALLVLAISAAYVLLGIVGHGVMRLITGKACEDRLARWPWEAWSS